jgi:hypothetical protein
VGIFPNDAAITRLVGAVLLEQHDHWQLEGRRMFPAESMATIPELGDTPALQAARGRPLQALAAQTASAHNRSAIG